MTRQGLGPKVAEMNSESAASRRAVTTPIGASLHPILNLQQTIGNRAVQRVIQDLSEERTQADRQKDGQPVAPLIKAAVTSPGHALDHGTRALFEAAFGYDFGQVKLHSDSMAAETAEAINAKAFTAGPEIVFATGQYSPGTSEGKRLIAHELAHVVQQESSPVSLNGELAISEPSDESELAADAMAKQVLAGSAIPGKKTKSPAKAMGDTVAGSSSTSAVYRQPDDDPLYNGPTIGPAPSDQSDQQRSSDSGDKDGEGWGELVEHGLIHAGGWALEKAGVAAGGLLSLLATVVGIQGDTPLHPLPPQQTPPDQAPNPPDQTPADPEQVAYQVGYADGKAGNQDDPISRVGFQYATSYESGYAAGKMSAPQ